MVTNHIPDEELQLYVLHEEHAGPGVSEHIHSCEDCRKKAEAYRSVIAGIRQQPEPAFDFNLAELVIAQLPASKSRSASDNLFTWLLTAVTVGFVIGVSYYFRSYFASLFEGVTTILFYLITVSAITVLTALGFDMYIKFQKKMKALDLN